MLAFCQANDAVLGAVNALAGSCLDVADTINAVGKAHVATLSKLRILNAKVRF